MVVGLEAAMTRKQGWFARNRHLYPTNWDEIAGAVKEAAGWCCEACGAPHGPPPHVLTVDHLDHDPGNSDPANLAALCQRCHLRRQGLKPRPASKAEALARLKARALLDKAQLTLDGTA